MSAAVDDAFVERWGDLVRGAVRQALMRCGLTPTVERVDDAVQDTWEVVCRRGLSTASFEAASPTTWLFRIATQTTTRAVRDSRRQKRSSNATVQLTDAHTLSLVSPMSPEATVALRQVVKLLAGLPDGPMILRLSLGEEPSDVAKAMNVGASARRKRIAAARMRLAEAI